MLYCHAVRSLVAASWACLVAARAGAAPPKRALAALADGTIAASEPKEVAAQLTALLAAATSPASSQPAATHMIDSSVEAGGGGSAVQWKVDARLIEAACDGSGSDQEGLGAMLLGALGQALNR